MKRIRSRRAALLALGVSGLAGLAGCGGSGDPTDPPPNATGVALVIAPSALLLAAAGDTVHLKAYSISATGDSTEVAATFTSSASSIVAMSSNVATGGAALGSAQIVAHSGLLESAPVLALRATPPPELCWYPMHR
jgi:hypothetical protein